MNKTKTHEKQHERATNLVALFLITKYHNTHTNHHTGQRKKKEQG